jgi:hypothetical protein
MIEFIGPLYNLLQHFTNHYLWLDTPDFWPHYYSHWTVIYSKLCYDRWSIGQSVLVSSTHVGLMTRILLLSDICGFVDVGLSLSLMREGVCRLQLLLILGSESRAICDNILLSQIQGSPNLEG